MPQYWDRQTGESNQAFAAFIAYRDLGPKRSVVAAYQQTPGKKAAKQANGGWNAWAKKFEWARRASAWDRSLDARKRESAEAMAGADGEQWAVRKRNVLERCFELALQLLKQAERLADMPVIRVTKSEAEGITVIEALPPRTLSTAATVAEKAAHIAMATIHEGLPEGDDGFDVEKATIAELQNYLERKGSARRP